MGGSSVNSRSITEILSLGADFAQIEPSALPYLSPLWDTLAVLIHSINKGKTTIPQLAEAGDISANTARNYLKALEAAGFPIVGQRIESKGRPLVYLVDPECIRWLQPAIVPKA
jgi:response regulator of citrate/malate metabolism